MSNAINANAKSLLPYALQQQCKDRSQPRFPDLLFAFALLTRWSKSISCAAAGRCLVLGNLAMLYVDERTTRRSSRSVSLRSWYFCAWPSISLSRARLPRAVVVKPQAFRRPFDTSLWFSKKMYVGHWECCSGLLSSDESVLSGTAMRTTTCGLKKVAPPPRVP